MSTSAMGAIAGHSSTTAHPSAAAWRAVYAATGPVDGETARDGVGVVDITRPADLAIAVSRDGGADDGSPVVVLGPPGAEHDMRVAASVLGGHRPGVPVALVLSDHAPLAGVLALRAARATARDAGQAVAVVRDVLADSWSAVVTDSVAGLDLPAPSLLQHLRSWLPGSRFIVRLGPRPAIVPASRPLLALDGAATRDRVLHMSPPPDRQADREADGGADTEAVADAVAAAIASWTTSKTVEGVTLPAGADAVAGLEGGIQLALMPAGDEEREPHDGPSCTVCGLTVTAPVCDFCRTRPADDPTLHPAGRAA